MSARPVGRDGARVRIDPGLVLGGKGWGAALVGLGFNIGPLALGANLR